MEAKKKEGEREGLKETDKEREREGEGESKGGGRQAGRREGRTNDSQPLLLTSQEVDGILAAVYPLATMHTG